MAAIFKLSPLSPSPITFLSSSQILKPTILLQRKHVVSCSGEPPSIRSPKIFLSLTVPCVFSCCRERESRVFVFFSFPFSYFISIFGRRGVPIFVHNGPLRDSAEQLRRLRTAPPRRRRTIRVRPDGPRSVPEAASRLPPRRRADLVAQVAPEMEQTDLIATSEILNIILTKDGYGNLDEQQAYPANLFGSPPTRTTNPLVQDPHFMEAKSNNTSLTHFSLLEISPNTTLIPTSPAPPTTPLRIEGFDCVGVSTFA